MPMPQQHLETAQSIVYTAADKIQVVAAAGVISLPLWRQKLHFVSEIATEIAPPLGVLFVVVQLIVKVMQARRMMREE